MTQNMLVAGLLAILFISVIVLVAVSASSKRPKPQPPPRDISDRDRFSAIKKDWENKP